MQECVQTSEIMSRIGSLFCGVIKGNCAPYWSELWFLILSWARGFFPSTWTCASMLLNLTISADSLGERDIHHTIDRRPVTLLSCIWKLRLMSREPYGDEIEFLLWEEVWFMVKWCELMSPEWDRPPVSRSSLSLSVLVMDSRSVWENETSSVIVWRCSRCLSANEREVNTFHSGETKLFSQPLKVFTDVPSNFTSQKSSQHRGLLNI